MLNYSSGDTHVCDWCDKEFLWTDDDIIVSYEEDADGRPFTRWEVICPHCGESVVVSIY